MWYLNAPHAGVTCGLWLVIYLYIRFTADEKPWGDVTQAILFRGIVSRLKTLVQRRDHAKFWRSSVLCLVQASNSHSVYSIPSLPPPPFQTGGKNRDLRYGLHPSLPRGCWVKHASRIQH